VTGVDDGVFAVVGADEEDGVFIAAVGADEEVLILNST
jgi:hypothetical protein